MNDCSSARHPQGLVHWIASPEGNVVGYSEEFDPVQFRQETQNGLYEIKALHETLAVENSRTDGIFVGNRRIVVDRPAGSDLARIR